MRNCQAVRWQLPLCRLLPCGDRRGQHGDVTGGEPQFAPRPIEAQQPDDIRPAWLLRRASTWSQLSRPNPLNHYAALRKLLLHHGDLLSKKIDAEALLDQVEVGMLQPGFQKLHVADVSKPPPPAPGVIGNLRELSREG
jgi:hypothetical protein